MYYFFSQELEIVDIIKILQYSSVIRMIIISIIITDIIRSNMVNAFGTSVAVGVPLQMAY